MSLYICVPLSALQCRIRPSESFPLGLMRNLASLCDMSPKTLMGAPGRLILGSLSVSEVGVWVRWNFARCEFQSKVSWLNTNKGCKSLWFGATRLVCSRHTVARRPERTAHIHYRALRPIGRFDSLVKAHRRLTVHAQALPQLRQPCGLRLGEVCTHRARPCDLQAIPTAEVTTLRSDWRLAQYVSFIFTPSPGLPAMSTCTASKAQLQK
jgi:hypothetical protein